MRTGHLVFVRDYHVLKYVCGDFFFFLIFLAHLEETFHEGSQILTTGPQFELYSYSHDDETEMCPLVCYFAVFEIVQSSSLPLFFIFYFFFFHFILIFYAQLGFLPRPSLFPLRHSENTRRPLLASCRLETAFPDFPSQTHFLTLLCHVLLVN